MSKELLLEAQLAQQKARRAIEAWLDSASLAPQTEGVVLFALLDIQQVLMMEVCRYDAGTATTPVHD